MAVTAVFTRAQSLRRTMERRPDLIARALTPEEEQLLAEFPAGEFPGDEGGR